MSCLHKRSRRSGSSRSFRRDHRGGAAHNYALAEAFTPEAVRWPRYLHIDTVPASMARRPKRSARTRLATAINHKTDTTHRHHRQCDSAELLIVPPSVARC
jgi:hypothetical protein